MKLDTGINLSILMDVAEEVVAPLMQTPIVIDRDNLSSGYAGVYNSFLITCKTCSGKIWCESLRNYGGTWENVKPLLVRKTGF